MNLPIPDLALAMGWTDLWYALPLIVAISLVYAGTRYEDLREILPRAARMAGWTVFFLTLFFVILLLIAWWL
jgi:hypothetical protein